MTDSNQQESSNENDSQENLESLRNEVLGASFAKALGTGSEIAQRIEGLQRHIREITKQFREPLDRYRKIGERISRQLEKIDWKPLQKALDELPERTDRIQSYLVTRGWYLPWGSFDLVQVHEIDWLIKRGKDEKIEALLCKYAKEHEIETVRREVPKLFSQREEIVQQTLEAHESGHYALTVPTLLSQAEGMFFEGLGRPFYRDDKRKESHRELKSDPDTAFAILTMDHLFQSGPLHEDYDGNPREVAQNRDNSFNRHLILHGHSTNYHTEANSLRAIALVGLTCRVVRRLEEE